MVMPKMGESIMEGTVLKWHKKVGDAVQKDETILDIATDKVDAEVPATESGVLAEIVVSEGATVPVGTIIARLETEASASVSAPVAPAKPEPAPAPVATNGNGHAKGNVAPAAPTATVAATPTVVSDSGDRFYSPVVLNIAHHEKVSMTELATIKGTGLDSRVTKNDLLAYVQARKGGTVAPAPVVESPVVQPAPVAVKPAAVTVSDGSSVEVVPMDNMRKLIAEHMVRSKHTSAHVTSVSEADVTGLVKLVKQNKESFEKANGIKLTFTPFFVEAIVKTIKQFPMVNASVDGDKIIIKKYVNLGMAVSLGEDGAGGLIVPVIKNADERNLVGIARLVNDLATRARTKKLSPDDISGGTFTLTNYGTSGNLFGAPIINQPQVAILGTGAIVKRPVVITQPDGTDTIGIRSMMYLSMSYDHRIIDGSLAGFFLRALTKNLEAYTEKTPL